MTFSGMTLEVNNLWLYSKHISSITPKISIHSQYIFSRIFLDLNLGVKILSLTDMDKNVNQWSLQISWQPSKHDITHGPISLDFFLMSNTGFIQWESTKSTIISYF